MPNTNFQTLHQMGGAINSFVKQATGRDNMQNIDMEHITVAQNHYYDDVDISGRVVSFNAGAAGIPLDKCLVQIEPVQEGAGDPSPDNVRPITGRDSVKVTVSPTTDEADGTTYSITLPSEAGTVYGGKLDVTTGELFVNWAMLVIDGVNKTVRNNGATSTTSNAWFSGAVGKAYGRANIISNRFAVLLGGAPGEMIGRDDSIGIEFKLPIDVPNTNEALNQWFADNPTQLCYELATPLTYQLTPQEVKTLLGTNNVWADTGDIEVKFKNIKEFF